MSITTDKQIDERVTRLRNCGAASVVGGGGGGGDCLRLLSTFNSALKSFPKFLVAGSIGLLPAGVCANAPLRPKQDVI